MALAHQRTLQRQWLGRIAELSSPKTHVDTSPLLAVSFPFRRLVWGTIFINFIFSTNNLKLYHKWLEFGIKELTKKIYKNCQLNKDVFFPFWFRFRAYKLSRGCSVANAHHLSHSQRKKNIINIFRMRLKLNFQRLTVSDGRKSWRRTVRQAINCLVISLFRLDLHVQILHTRRSSSSMAHNTL